MKGLLTGCAVLLRQSWSRDRRRLVVAVVLMVGQSVALPLSAPALAAVVEAALAGDAARAGAFGAVTALLVIASLTFGHFAHIAYYELGELNSLTHDREMADLANGTAGLEHHDRREDADRLDVLRKELRRVGQNGLPALIPGIGLTIGIVVTAVLLARLSPWLLLLPLAALPPLVTGRWAEDVLGRARDRAAEPTRRAQHLVRLTTDATQAKEVRICGLEGELRRRHAVSWKEATAVLWRAEVRAAALRISGQLVFAAGYVGTTLIVVRGVVGGDGGVGAVVLAIALAAQVNQQVTTAVGLVQEAQRTARAMSGVAELRRRVAAEAPAPADARPPDRLTDGIRLRGVHFRYEGADRPVLREVDLHLPAGSIVAVVGENGAGKTTLVKLLARFYRPQRGVVEVDGIDTARFPVEAWRSRITAAFQDFTRFEFTAQRTVGVGDLPFVDSEPAVLAALERAQGLDVLDALPDGLDSPLGNSSTAGTPLSGGQWQKLALGRAMMRQSPLLLVLDEPTAAIDAEAEHRLFEQYAAGARQAGRATGAITVLVSHRFSTVRMADLILVMEEGGVVEQGSHDDLMALDGRYAELYRLQALAYS